MLWYILLTVAAVLVIKKLMFKDLGDLGKVPYACHVIRLFNISNADMWKKLRDLTDELGDRYVISGFRRTVLHTSRPSDIEVILSHPRNIKKGLVYSFLEGWLGTGLLISSGAKWHKRRKILTPTFHFNILKNFALVIEEKSKDLVEKLKREVDDQAALEVDVMRVISECTLYTICETAMGTKLDEDHTDKQRAYKQSVLELGPLVLNRIPRLWFWWDFLYFNLPVGRRYLNHLKTVLAFADDVITKKKKEMLVQSGIVNQEDDVGIKKRLAMLDLLLEAERKGEIDLEGIREEVNTFMFEGHDTTAMALSFGLMVLAKHEHVQDQMVEELRQVVGAPGRAATASELGELRYLDAVVKEVLRLYPSVPFVTRAVTEDFQMGDIFVKKGTELALHFYDLHRREDMYERPHEFRPERFVRGAPTHTFAFVPFSAGPRNCIGQRFAMLEMKCILSEIVRTFRLSPRGADPVMQADLVLRPVHPIYVNFTIRK